MDYKVQARKMLNAAKNPQYWSKLEQAPISLISRNAKRKVDKFQTEANIDEYIGTLIDGVISGDLGKIKKVPSA